ncbi:MAG: folate-binding protein [Pseudomonadota bacterium]|nr:folate-binding protein [Pseudomonadota bacterium]
MNSRLRISGACRLDDWGVIRARGADAGKFLQGQLTNDVVGLAAGRACLAGFCSAKGRLQASFVVWKAGDDEFLLACSAGLLAPTLKRLSMFVLRAQCKLSDASGELALWGIAGMAAAPLLDAIPVWGRRERDETIIIRLPDGAAHERGLVAAPFGVDLGSRVGAAIDLDAWHWLQVQSGVVTIEAATVDRFVPQMVNFERVGGVDFQKGCYPGQEVVARSQYRGTTKRRAFLFDCDDALPAVGQDVYAAASPHEPAGTVANAAPRPGNSGGSALIEVRLAALGGEALRLGSVDGALLRRVEMPYVVSIEAEAA